VESTSSELTVDKISREFPDVEALGYNGMYYAKLSGVVIAAAPSASELREQICDYFARMREAEQ
jgi:hypothetical protein